MALQLGHRISYDLDFFTSQEFDAELVLPEIKKISDFHLEKIALKTILGKFKDVKFSIFYYEYPLLRPLKKFGIINIVDIYDIAAMKISAISSRGVKRDFVDLYFIPGLALERRYCSSMDEVTDRVPWKKKVRCKIWDYPDKHN